MPDPRKQPKPRKVGELTYEVKPKGSRWTWTAFEDGEVLDRPTTPDPDDPRAESDPEQARQIEVDYATEDEARWIAEDFIAKVRQRRAMGQD